MQLAHPGFKVARRRPAHLQAKTSQDASKAHLQVVMLALHLLAVRRIAKSDAIELLNQTLIDARVSCAAVHPRATVGG
jgi:hypothetical protein